MGSLAIAGATGALGKVVLAEAKRRGITTRALGRRAQALAALGADHSFVCDPLRGRGLTEALAGADAVFSSLGASVLPSLTKGYRSYPAVDTPANLHLIEAAIASGVRRFIYVSVAGHPSFDQTVYVRAHEAVVEALERSPLEYVVLRPTGFFSAFLELLPMARRGPLPLIGDPEAKTNPISDRDLACFALDQLEGPARVAHRIGGPEILSRAQISALAFEALGKPPRTLRLPDAVVQAMALLLRPLSPRVSDFMRFILRASSVDTVATPIGSDRLAEAFAAGAKRQG
ncbi:MAG: NAD(P)H-binding protein [Myxococcota bacterium]